MKKQVTIIPADKLIIVDGVGYELDFSAPENIHAIQWRGSSGHCEYTDASANMELTAEMYEAEIAPYVELWEAEKVRIEEEQAKAEAEYNKFENVQARKLSELSGKFSAAEAEARLTSSLGFEINAGEKANRDIDGLIKLMEAMPDMETVDFCCYDNTFRAVTLADLKTMQVEVILSGNALYAQKWAFREAINAATKKEELEAVQIKFVFSDFSVKEEAKAE